jgi:general secretion pathway protein M
MTAQFLAWWRERSLREQRMLLAMFALVAVTILWLGIYRPLQNGLSGARSRHLAAVVRLGEVRAQAEALRAGGRRAAPAGPLAELVSRSAADSGFGNATVAPQGDRRVSVSIPSARPASVLRWVAGLEAQGMIVERFNARANADPTLTVDLVLARGG